MFKKVTTSKQTDYKQCVSYKEQMPYHSRLAKAKAVDLRNNSKVIDLKNGYAKLVKKMASSLLKTKQ